MPPRMLPTGSGGRAMGGDKQQVGPDGLLDPSLKPKPMNRIRKRDVSEPAPLIAARPHPASTLQFGCVSAVRADAPGCSSAEAVWQV